LTDYKRPGNNISTSAIVCSILKTLMDSSRIL